MKRETGRVEQGYFWFYFVPQVVMAGVALLVWITLLAAVIHYLNPEAATNWPFVQQVLPFLALDNLIPLLLFLTVMGGFIQLNALSRLALFLFRGLSFLPVDGLSGAFGPKGRSAGWIQAECICATWDKGQPLLIAQEEMERVSDELLLKLSASNYKATNYAPKPAKASTAAAGNIALFGCLIEAAHKVNRWEKPKAWTSFYEALTEIHDETNMFEPQVLTTFSGQAFSQNLRDLLAAKMSAKNEAVAAENYYGAASYVAKAWTLLDEHAGSVLKLIPIYAGFIGTKLYWLNRELGKFPLLQDDSMRPQLIKILTRWDVTPWAKNEDFLPPFSKTVSWLLLEEGVLRTFPEQKEVTFWGRGDVGISSAACRRIFEHVRKASEEGLSVPARSVAVRFPEKWDLLAAADYTLWNWGQMKSGEGQKANWAGYHWKIDGGRASRVK